MRFLLAGLLFFPFLGHGQDTTRILSEYEKFSGATGKVYKTETKEIKKIKDITVSLVKTTELESKRSITAVQVFQKNTSFFSSINVGALYVDMNELQGLSGALKYYQQQAKGGKPQHQTSLMYVTSNNVQATCSYAEGTAGGWFVTISPRYPSKNMTGAVLKNNEIDDLAEAISSAISATF